LAEGTAYLLGFVHQKRQQQQQGKHHGKMLLAMSIIMLKIIV
jgi:hypothetical protein